jgi:hypothetical protein
VIFGTVLPGRQQAATNELLREWRKQSEVRDSIADLKPQRRMLRLIWQSSTR